MKVQELQKKHAAHNETVTPGQPFTLSDVHQPGEGVWQGDLGVEVVDAIPADYVEVKDLADSDRQLVPEGGAGSHHRIRSLDGVTLYRPKGWGESETDLRGPCVVFDTPNEIVHQPGHGRPHGTVVIASAMIVLCRYQRNLAADEREARRAMD